MAMKEMERKAKQVDTAWITLIVLYSDGDKEEGDVKYGIYFQPDNNWQFLGTWLINIGT